MKFFFDLKHWQLFLLTTGMILGVAVIALVTLNAAYISGRHPGPDIMLSSLQYLMLATLVPITVSFGWSWSVGFGMQQLLPETMRSNTHMFMWSLVFPIICIVGVMMEAWHLMNFLKIPDSTKQEITDELSWIVIIPALIPFFLFAVLCELYRIYFIAMTLKTLELQRKVSFNDYWREFLLVGFSMIGVWIVQPRINRVVQK